jgi:hypothetical protein
VIRLISAGLLLVGAFAASAAAFRWLLGPAAPVPGGLGTVGRVITGLVQVACLAAAVVVVTADGRRLSTSASPSSTPRRGRWTWTWPNCWPRWRYWPARTGSSPPQPVSSALGGWLSWRLLQRMGYV